LRAVIFDIETSYNPKLFSLALSSALERAKAGAEIDEQVVKSEMALSPLYGRIIAVGALDAEADKPLVFTGDEREILQAFWKAAQGYDFFVGWNSLAFDVPFLELRSWLNGIEPTFEISQRRYAVTNHVDLYMLMTAWKGNRFKLLKHDLSSVALALGLKPPMGDGAQIPTLYERGDLDAIKEHLKSDLQAIKAIWERLGRPGVEHDRAFESVPF